MKIDIFLFMLSDLLFFASIVGCAPEPGDGKTVIINTTPEERLDGGTVAPDRQTATVDICSTKITFVLTNGTGSQIQIDNRNDTTVIVHILNSSMGGVVAKKCLWAGNQESQEAAFSKGDKLLTQVYIGEGQLWHWTCAEFIDDLIHNFPLCSEVNIVIQ